MKLLIVGDVHCSWGKLNTLINRRRPDAVIQVGDFGYWPGEYERKIRYASAQTRPNMVPLWGDGLIKSPVPIYFCDGNHENHERLAEFTEPSNELLPNIFYQKRGSVQNFNGLNVMFMGGADSIDKKLRTPGKDWFPEETIKQKDIWDLDQSIDVDMMISHACPTEILRQLMSYKNDVSYYDPSTDALAIMLEIYRPVLWYFGHYHLYKEGKIKDTRWTCLDMVDGIDRCWREVIV